MKVLMIPTYENIVASKESGIKRVCEAYYKYLPSYGFEFVGRGQEYDISAVHAGITGSDCDVAILHGLYWTADYTADHWEYEANANITQAVRSAKQITVPSDWVAETIRRDLRCEPTIIPHGIVAEDWAHDFQNEGYVLWNKNRNADVCDPTAIAYLARRYPNISFVSTFSPDKNLTNVKEIGHLYHDQMKVMVQKAGVYLSTTKETFGIGVLEAMASGVPVLGYRWGGNIDLVKHGVNGWLAEPGDVEGLIRGLAYCFKHRSILGANALELVKNWTWDEPIRLMAEVFKKAADWDKPSVAVVIPTYNYSDKVGRAIDSVLAQSRKADEIIVVDDGSNDNPKEKLAEYIDKGLIKLIQKANGGVATARNRGIQEAKSKYIVCLDADDKIEPAFIEVCLDSMIKNPTLGIAYTRLQWVDKTGNSGISAWPDKFDYSRQLERGNQIPTCCMFKREMWERTGGYKQRYAPMGAGAEDAEFWLRAGAYGFNAALVTDLPLFTYSVGTGAVSGNKNYREVDWLVNHPWIQDKQYPFASIAKPARLSHPVRQYDRPAVSVIIPVGEGHENLIENALDSLESQSFRKWEVIVVWDSPHPYAAFEKYKAYPYMRMYKTKKPKSGPGVARNLGVKHARGGFILFLDADDWLMPNALSTMMIAWQKDNSIVYSDYYGKFKANSEEELNQFGDRLVDFNTRTRDAVVKHQSAEYSCEKAQAQPSRELYHWCLVTCLIPKLWHEKIGGFDEDMESFEDVDYHWRMARAGYCYTRVPEPLVMYCFATGSRRENASPYDERTRQRAVGLLEYMLRKYEDIQKMPCISCGGNTVDRPYYPALAQAVNSERSANFPEMNDEAFVKVRYTHPNIGDHRVVGASTRIDYGYRSGGDIFLVHKDDIKLAPHLFLPIEVEPGKVEPPKAEPVITPEPEPIMVSVKEATVSVLEQEISSVEDTVVAPVVFQFDAYALPGVSEAIAKDILDSGISSYDGLVKTGVDGLMAIKGIGKAKAELIIKYAKGKIGA